MKASAPGWSAAALQAARAAIDAAFPSCPKALVERFVLLLDAPREVLIARATRILEKPYGCNHLLDAEGGHGVSFALLYPGRTTSLHFHEQRRELFAVRSGRLSVILGTERRLLVAGEAACSTPHVPHALENEGREDLEVLELFSPYLLDDKTRVHDPYGRPIGAVTVDQ